jgi:hypothetical protein
VESRKEEEESLLLQMNVLDFKSDIAISILMCYNLLLRKSQHRLVQ